VGKNKWGVLPIDARERELATTNRHPRMSATQRTLSVMKRTGSVGRVSDSG